MSRNLFLPLLRFFASLFLCDPFLRGWRIRRKEAKKQRSKEAKKQRKQRL
jgi:hypothetical protein